MDSTLERIASLFSHEDSGQLARRVLEPLFEQDKENLREFARCCELARARAVVGEHTRPGPHDLLLGEAELLDCLRRLVWTVRNAR
jgi:hypothetical protein